MGVFESLLNNTFDVEAPTRASDGQGGWTRALIDVGTVQGRIRPANSNERVTADSEEQQITHVLYLKTLTTSGGGVVARGAYVETGDLRVEVLGVREPSEMAHHWEIDCLERQDEVLEDLGS